MVRVGARPVAAQLRGAARRATTRADGESATRHHWCAVYGRTAPRQRGPTRAQQRAEGLRANHAHARCGVGDDAAAAHLCVHVRASSYRRLHLLEHQDRCAFPHDESVALSIERPAGSGCIVVVSRAMCARASAATSHQALERTRRVHATAHAFAPTCARTLPRHTPRSAYLSARSRLNPTSASASMDPSDPPASIASAPPSLTQRYASPIACADAAHAVVAASCGPRRPCARLTCAAAMLPRMVGTKYGLTRLSEPDATCAPAATMLESEPMPVPRLAPTRPAPYESTRPGAASATAERAAETAYSEKSASRAAPS